MEQAIEYFGVVTGLIYLTLEIKQHRAMWIAGFITSFVYIFVFFFAKFYADMGLNVYYVSISAYGFYKWRKISAISDSTDSQIVYRRIDRTTAVGVTIATVFIFFVLRFILDRYTDSPMPIGDAFTTSLSITATWMLAHRIIEHWGFWVLINVVSAVLYYNRELYPTCGLFVCYMILAVVGFVNWKKKGVLYAGKI